MRKIAFINEKGGSCKTTLAVNCASFFALKKKKVLLVDMDPQGQVGKALGVDVRSAKTTVLELLLARCPNVKAVKELAAEYGIEGEQRGSLPRRRRRSRSRTPIQPHDRGRGPPRLRRAAHSCPSPRRRGDDGPRPDAP